MSLWGGWGDLSGRIYQDYPKELMTEPAKKGIVIIFLQQLHVQSRHQSTSLPLGSLGLLPPPPLLPQTPHLHLTRTPSILPNRPQKPQYHFPLLMHFQTHARQIQRQ